MTTPKPSDVPSRLRAGHKRPHARTCLPGAPGWPTDLGFPPACHDHPPSCLVIGPEHGMEVDTLWTVW